MIKYFLPFEFVSKVQIFIVGVIDFKGFDV